MEYQKIIILLDNTLNQQFTDNISETNNTQVDHSKDLIIQCLI